MARSDQLLRGIHADLEQTGCGLKEAKEAVDELIQF